MNTSTPNKSGTPRPLRHGNNSTPIPEPPSVFETRILLVEDHEIVRVGLQKIILKGFGRCVFGEADNGRKALVEFDKAPWSVVILDLNLPERAGLDVLNEMKARRPKIPVLVLSALSQAEVALRVIKSGAAGFVPKETCSDELVRALRKVIAGGRYISAAVAEQMASDLVTETPAAPHEKLSDREYTVLKMIGAGQSVTEIARSLCLSPKTVSTYRTQILLKMELKTNADLIRYALKQSLVQ